MTAARRTAARAAAAVFALTGAACAARAPLPPPDVVQRAGETAAYSAELRVRLKGPELRARTRALVAFRRPDALRVEIPGPTGARLVAVARAGRLWAVFPGERAVFSGPATAADLENLLGVALAPGEVMDVLVGRRPAAVRAYEARWGPYLPRAIQATLPDGARLQVDVKEPLTDPDLPDAAFDEPPHAGYRTVDAEEARTLWTR
jgi:hypothetical protein